jgi:AbrB family looped-hinge helix DNA binding protein
MTTTVTIDEQGRVELPEELRQRLHLEPGDAVELREDGEKIVVSPIPAGSHLERKGSLLVLNSELPEDFQAENWVEKIRQSRITDLWNASSR